MIEKLKKLLKIHNFSGQVELKDGTQIILDGTELAVGVKVFIQLPDSEEMTELPDGEYQLIDDSILIVENGTISDIVDPEQVEEVVEEEVVETEEEVVEEEPKEEEVVEEDLTEKIKTLEDRLSKLEELITKEEMEKIKQSSDKLTSEFNELKEKVSLSTDVKKLPLQKIVDDTPVSKTEERYNNIKKSLKNN